jgi:hypothetical protein
MDSTCARIVEVASRRSVERVSEEELFDALDIPESSRCSTDAQIPRLGTAHQKTDRGLVKTQNSLSIAKASL